MKKLILIGGTMGVGKTTVSKVLQQRLEKCVFLDGDWCWDMHPFVVNDQMKAMVMDNITYMLNNFIKADDIENIIFCWVMHEQEIIDNILSSLDLENVCVYPISLICSLETLTFRIQKDINRGLRKEDVFKRSLERLNMYKSLNTYLLDTTYSSIEETVQTIYDYIQKETE